MIRGISCDPLTALRTLAREYSVSVGTSATASGYHMSVTTLVSASNTPGAAIGSLGTPSVPVTTHTRQTTNICFTMALGTGTGITYVITVGGINYFGDYVTEDVTLTDTILVASTAHCYSKLLSVVCESFAGTAGTAAIGIGYSNGGASGLISLLNANGYRIPVPSKNFTYADLVSVSVNSQATQALNVGLAAATSATAPTWTYVGAPYYCLMLRGSTDGTTLAATLPSNPTSTITVRVKSGVGLS